MPRPLMGTQTGLGDYTVIQYLFIYSPCRGWGWNDGVSHPTSLPCALGGPETPRSGSSLWRPPSQNIVGPKVVLNVLGPSTCVWMCPLFSPKPLLGGWVARQTGARNTRAPTLLLTGQHHGFIELASLCCAPPHPPAEGRVLGREVDAYPRAADVAPLCPFPA
uniref:Uncharacterized protein n=1 Tax=Mus musculus TaxID=10090 RepID=Q3TDM7_MOUSE|nr:unnamed protein product [Mus musculus]